ncbi:MAG: amidohydrolase [Candidatus Micrarchaeia archaeon]|jgi:5-methylthioadenosine/S-adenosylhomocysteine deaminase
MSILIRNVLLGGSKTDIFIEDNRIARIGDCKGMHAEHVIDGTHKAALPGLFNGHTHAAMTLFRGYADDMPLQEWLTQKIWPLEKKLTDDDVYWGTKLACLEMIKSGTTFFNDMYFHLDAIIKAVDETGMRALLSPPDIDFSDDEKAEKQLAANEKFYLENSGKNSRIRFALGPHSPYGASMMMLLWAKEFSQKYGIPVHIHVSETEWEVQELLSRHGLRPVEFLEKIGLLSPRLIACHCLWLDDHEISLLAKRKVKVVHNPASNLKLASGHGGFPYKKLVAAGIRPVLGTDGTSSNNNLDMFEAMKLASLLQKSASNDPTALPAAEALEMATINAADAFGINAGLIAKGRLADIILIDLKTPQMVPNHNLVSNLVYSANGSCVDTTICDGKILMQGRVVDGEEEILEKAQDVAKDIISRN